MNTFSISVSPKWLEIEVCSMSEVPRKGEALGLLLLLLSLL